MPKYGGSGGGVKLGDSPIWTGTHTFNVNPIITNSAPGIAFTDTTGSAKSLTIDVDSNSAALYESAAARSSFLVIDLTNTRLGIGGPPTERLHVVSGNMLVDGGDIKQTGGNVIRQTNQNLYLQTDTAAKDIIFRTNISTERMRIADTGGLIGIGTAGATALLHLVGYQPANVSSTPGTNATQSLLVTGAIGGLTTITTTGTGGVGGPVSITSGAGAPITTATTAATGGKGGALTISSGAGGAASAATGSDTGGAGGAWAGFGGVGGAATVGGGTLTGGAGGLVELGAGSAGAGGNAAGGVTYIYGGDKTGSGAAGFVQLGLNSSAAAVGGGVVIGSATGSDKGAGTLNIAGTIWSNGTQGVASYGPAAVTSITIKNGLVTAIS